MSEEDHARREKLAAAIHEYASAEGYATGFMLVVEVGRYDGGQMILHRTQDLAAGGGLSAWDHLGMAEAAATLARHDLIHNSDAPE
jgi:hypothetical protein